MSVFSRVVDLDCAHALILLKFAAAIVFLFGLDEVVVFSLEVARPLTWTDMLHQRLLPEEHRSVGCASSEAIASGGVFSRKTPGFEVKGSV